MVGSAEGAGVEELTVAVSVVGGRVGRRSTNGPSETLEVVLIRPRRRVGRRTYTPRRRHSGRVGPHPGPSRPPG